LSAVIAEKLRLNDDALSCGTLDEGDVLPEVGVVLDDVVDEPLLPQPAATKAAQAASAVVVGQRFERGVP
jgi:hypothetical protein